MARDRRRKEEHDRRADRIKSDPRKYLERALLIIRHLYAPDLVRCLYRNARFGSPSAQKLLRSSIDWDGILIDLPFGICLEAVSWQDKEKILFILTTLGFQELHHLMTAEVLREIEHRL